MLVAPSPSAAPLCFKVDLEHTNFATECRSKPLLRTLIFPQTVSSKTCVPPPVHPFTTISTFASCRSLASTLRPQPSSCFPALSFPFLLLSPSLSHLTVASHPSYPSHRLTSPPPHLPSSIASNSSYPRLTRLFPTLSHSHSHRLVSSLQIYPSSCDPTTRLTFRSRPAKKPLCISVHTADGRKTNVAFRIRL